MQTTIVFLSLHSRSAAHERERVETLLAKHGLGDLEIRTVDHTEMLRAEVERAVSSGAQRVIVGGGDGSMLTAATALAHSDCVLGVLPLGTGNSFAQTLEIGEDLERAVEIIAGGCVARVDLGLVNGKHFVNFATIGFTATVAATTPKFLKWLVGPIAYVLGGIVPALWPQPFKAKIRCDGDKMKMTTQQIVVASGRIFGKRPLLPDANITDGKLAFFAVSGSSTVDLARTFIALAVGNQTELKDAFAFSARKIDIRTKPKQAINGDGQPLSRTPARFRIDRRALRVFVPPEFVDRTQ